MRQYFQFVNLFINTYSDKEKIKKGEVYTSPLLFLVINSLNKD